MQKGGEGVQIACKIAYVLNGRPLIRYIRFIVGTFPIQDKLDLKVFIPEPWEDPWTYEYNIGAG